MLRGFRHSTLDGMRLRGGTRCVKKPTAAVAALALKLPDHLLVRYFRAGEIDELKAVKEQKGRIIVKIGEREDRWRSLGEGAGFVPDV